MYIQGMPKQIGESIEMPSGCVAEAAGVEELWSILQPVDFTAASTTRHQERQETVLQ